VKPSGILLFGDTDMFPVVASRAALEADLRAVQRNVPITNLNNPILPTDLSAYGTIWYVGAFSPISSSDQTRLVDFLRRGGGLYLTGERQPCLQCGPLNESVQTFLRQVTGVSGISVGVPGDFPPPEGSPLLPVARFNPAARGTITTLPNGLTVWVPNGPGIISGISGGNVLATIGDSIVAGVWNESDLNAGRMVVMMDVNWLSDDISLQQCDAACRQAIVENLVTFLDDPVKPIVVNGPLFRSVNETFSTWSSFFDLPNMSITNLSTDPLLWFSGSTLTTRGVFSRMTNSTIATGGSLLRLDSGAQLIQTGTDPLVSMSGGSLSVGTGTADGHLFDLVGRAGSTEIDFDSGLRVGADRPIQPGTEASVFDTDNGAVVNVRGNAYKVDMALLEATAPLLNLKGGTSFTTGDHAVSLVGGAKVSIPNDAVSMVTLKASMLTVARGNLVNVAGGSVFNIAGNLVSLADVSTLNILNGLLLNVSGGSSASIGRSLVSFSGVGNVLNINNSIVPTAIVNGIPVSGPVDSFRIGANAIGGAGAGTIRINGVALTPTTPLSSLTGSLVAIQGTGTVNVGVPALGGGGVIQTGGTPPSLPIK